MVTECPAPSLWRGLSYCSDQVVAGISANHSLHSEVWHATCAKKTEHRREFVRISLKTFLGKLTQLAVGSGLYRQNTHGGSPGPWPPGGSAAPPESRVSPTHRVWDAPSPREPYMPRRLFAHTSALAAAASPHRRKPQTPLNSAHVASSGSMYPTSAPLSRRPEPFHPAVRHK